MASGCLADAGAVEHARDGLRVPAAFAGGHAFAVEPVGDVAEGFAVTAPATHPGDDALLVNVRHQLAAVRLVAVGRPSADVAAALTLRRFAGAHPQRDH